MAIRKLDAELFGHLDGVLSGVLCRVENVEVLLYLLYYLDVLGSLFRDFLRLDFLRLNFGNQGYRTTAVQTSYSRFLFLNFGAA